MFRSNPTVVFSSKDTVQIQSEPTGEQARKSVIPTKLLCNFIEITPMHGCASEDIHRTCKTPLPGRTPFRDCCCMSKYF